LKNNKGATIVYVTLQKQTEELAAELRRKGFKARSFHAGMETGTKIQLQDEFMREEELVIVATIAFGMGMYISVFPLPHHAITLSLSKLVTCYGMYFRSSNQSVLTSKLPRHRQIIHTKCCPLQHSKQLGIL
jgi:superfamily II DNA helicase RecQ